MEDYIFVQGMDDTGVFIKESTIISIRFDLAKSAAVIVTNDEQEYPVFGVLAVNQLHDHYYQRAALKLFRDKQ